MKLRNYIASILLLLLATQVNASRIKDLTTISGQRDNQLIGYGLVVGLSGDGDSQQASYTVQSVANMLQRFGVTVSPDDIRSNNVAAVIVTADISSFAEFGSRIDVTISSMGDADSLSGGILLQTPLMGADDEVYAVAQGPVLLGGFSVGSGDSANVQKNHPTVGRLPGGAIIERTVRTQIVENDAITFMLRNPDYASAVLMAEKINHYFPGVAQALSAQNLEVHIPEHFRNSVTSYIASLEAIEVDTDQTARVVMNERTGTIVATSDVRISAVAVSHGNITVTVTKTPFVSQPNAFSGGETVSESTASVEVVEQLKGGFSQLDAAPSLSELTTSLNSLGVSSRDMMNILQTLKRAGALHAELIME